MDEYVRRRSAFLERARLNLQDDGRFAAAWLGGSFGRDEVDEYSDVDIWLAVHDEHAASICERTSPSQAGTVDTRREIVSRFGDPAIIHEHHANAPPGGTFTSTVYRESGLIVDWTLVPLSNARTGWSTRLLFDHVGIQKDPDAALPPQNERLRRLQERYAFFWLLSIPAAKAFRRNDGVRFHSILDMMCGALREIRALIDGQQLTYTRHSLTPFCRTPEAQREALLKLCQQAASMSEELMALGASIPDAPMDALNPWLAP